MGYHTAREIPNYWAYARRFVLQDHMFQPNTSWSLPAHLFAVSEWSARCSKRGDPMSCVNAIQSPPSPPGEPQSDGTRPDYAWTDLTYLLHKHHVSWRYYVFKGGEPDCEDDGAMFCKAKKQNAKTPGIWNPLPWFTTVRQNGEPEEHPFRPPFLSGGEARAAAGRLVGDPERQGQRAPAGARQ